MKNDWPLVFIAIFIITILVLNEPSQRDVVNNHRPINSDTDNNDTNQVYKTYMLYNMSQGKPLFHNGR